jgi:hypothetical protein
MYELGVPSSENLVATGGYLEAAFAGERKGGSRRVCGREREETGLAGGGILDEHALRGNWSKQLRWCALALSL